MNLVIKPVGKHSPECGACTARNGEPVGFYFNTYAGLKHISLDSIGRKNGTSYRWVRANCNYPDCPANVLVRLDAVEAEVTKLAYEVKSDA